jgi:Auxiliary Activity family 9 (formerly GH61)
MRAGTGTATIAAGGTLGFVADQGVTHPGPLQFYMAKVPEDKDINAYEATGNVWFKVASINGTNPTGKTSGFTWPTYSIINSSILSLQRSSTNACALDQKIVNFTVPKSIPSGKYLVRVESIALHQAQSPGGAQFYLSCAQVEITGGGNGTPGPMVSFPGAYKAGEPGLIFSWQTTSYMPPGPQVWEG